RLIRPRRDEPRELSGRLIERRLAAPRRREERQKDAPKQRLKRRYLRWLRGDANERHWVMRISREPRKRVLSNRTELLRSNIASVDRLEVVQVRLNPPTGDVWALLLPDLTHQREQRQRRRRHAKRRDITEVGLCIGERRRRDDRKPRPAI